ncbi:hypothetical protein HNP92_001683 [Methanococcus maripaludis]|uniref:Uncharacterized protein n=1 Tax=Methanococcus maripaludis TaxID=39152 RepID=A0A7J9P0V5_METMI|nr:hypothetical protein [Methanococcus maripaludis]MBA2853569.1 hypothetical protein [Methanococcus maripaludis]MBA2860789.1 hypothetical protein [Methanococcus maripaludis]MBA2868780.1 hypothetical protein [Methanococcus maripaludis]MBB6402361.1 hypothetical protein [Methanococcus maripaludis]
MSNCCKNENCNCVKLDCPNRGDCKACINTHLKAGSLVYCMQDMLEKK